MKLLIGKPGSLEQNYIGDGVSCFEEGEREGKRKREREQQNSGACHYFYQHANLSSKRENYYQARIKWLNGLDGDWRVKS